MLFKNKTQYVANNYQKEYDFEIRITKPLWLPLFFEQWLVPHFTIFITNKGKTIERGELSCYILEHSDVSNFPAEDKNFRDYQHFQIKDFKEGQTLKYKCKIESRFIKPTSYMVKLIINEYDPVNESPYDTLWDILRKAYKDDVNKINLTITEIENKTLPLSREIPKNTFRVVPLINFRWLEVIKIHPTSTLLTFLGIVIPILIGIITFITKKFYLF